MSSKSIKTLIWIIKGGIFILPVLSLIIAGSLFFPFITGKNMFFRTVVEILFFLWILLAVFDKQYRPKKSPLLFALSAVVLILTLATIFGENPYRSFWSNYERMEGLISHLHLFAYFLILSSVFKKERDFKWLFVVLLTVSAILSIYGYLQFFGKLTVHQGGTKLDATLGNSTYLAILIVFHLFIISWLFLKTSNVWLRSILAFLFIFELPIVYYTTTRGAILGFIGGLMMFAFLVGIFSKQRKIRYYFLALLGVFILVIMLFIVFKNMSFIQKSPVLLKLASISFKETTVEARLTIWKMGFEAFKKHPILGWGPENFNLVFNQYYEPNLWNKEPWFDRAHNIIFDWLIAAGILGFLVYWSVFGSALFMLWRRGNEGNATSLGSRIPLARDSFIEPILLTSLFAAYSFHNLFVFDNITSYYLFFTVLGFVNFRYQNSKNNLQATTYNLQAKLQPKFQVPSSKFQVPSSDLSIGHYLIITAVFILVVFALYFVNLKPYLAAKQLLTALKDIAAGQSPENVLKDFDKVFSYRTFGTSEAREQLSGYANSIVFANQIPQEQKVKVFTKAIQEMEEQAKSAPTDARYYLFLSALYTKTNRIQDGLNTINKALEFSPKKQQIYFVLADIYLALGQNEKALEIVKTAYDLDQKNYEAGKNLAILAILNNKPAEGETLLEKHFGKKIIADKSLINAYAKIGNYKRVKEIWLELLENEPNNPQYYVSLAAAHLQLGERQESIKALEKVIEINPQFKEQGEYFIKEIRAGRNP